MKAQLTLDGEVIAQGGKFAMSTELILEHNFYDPRRRVAPVSAHVIVGEYFAIGVDGGQINPNLLTQTKTQLEQVKTELETIKQQLDANQTPVISDFLTKHTLTGNLLQTGILGYFAINAALDQMDAKSMDVVTNRLPSIGTFSTSLIPQYAFGYIPRNVKLSGLLMDVNRVTTVAVAKDNNRQKSINFFRATGPRESAFEHLVPDQLFSTPTQPAQGISAVKALAIAAGQGQKIYTLTKANAAQLDTLSIGQAAKSEIAAALNANKEVTVHQGPITYAGWIGEGYIIIDPETGAGAYKISGGANGAELARIWVGFLMILAIALVPLFFPLGFAVGAAVMGGALFTAVSFGAQIREIAKLTSAEERRLALNSLLLLIGAELLFEIVMGKAIAITGPDRVGQMLLFMDLMVNAAFVAIGAF